jgi:hypothetical protein
MAAEYSGLARLRQTACLPAGYGEAGGARDSGLEDVAVRDIVD